MKRTQLVALGLCALSAAFSPSLRAAPDTAPPAPAQAPAPASASESAVKTELLPAPELSTSVLGPDGALTITLPANFPFNATRLRIGLFEAGRPVRIADTERDFDMVAGKPSASLILQASPGRYDVCLTTNDKAKQPISAAAPLLVPGIDREPGWWLLNGSPFIRGSENGYEDKAISPVVAPNPGTPLFAPGLKRDLDKRARPISRMVNAPQAVSLLQNQLVPLPAFEDMLKPGYDFASLDSYILAAMNTAKGDGRGNMLGFALGITETGFRDRHSSTTDLKNVITHVRSSLEKLAPEAALVLVIRNLAATGSSDEGVLINTCAPLCDATILYAQCVGFIDGMVFPPLDWPDIDWPIKVARRNAEEQANYDLPFFSQVYGPSVNELELKWLDAVMGGATGILDAAGQEPAVNNDGSYNLSRALQRNLPLFVGSVTLEDIGLLPAPDDQNADFGAIRLYKRLREAQRIPLLARLPEINGRDKPEPFFMELGDRISTDTIERIRKAASAGARIYLEGAPFKDETGAAAGWRLGSLVGGEATLLPDRRTIKTAMILDDGWMFGTRRGTQVALRQTVAVTLGKGTMAGQAKQERGKYTLAEPYAAAHLQDGSPALVVNPVGKGEIIWMPGSLDDTVPHASDGYYTAVAAYLQAPLVQVRGADAVRGTDKARTDTGAGRSDATDVRVALRRSPKGAYIVALFNDGGRDAPVAASIDGVAGVALDLGTETELPLSVNGNTSQATVTVPHGGWKLIAFAQNRAALDAERNAPRLTGKFR